MKVGFVGCGKLGLMVALTIESRGHEVRGYDPNPNVAHYLEAKQIPFKEENAAGLLAMSCMKMVSLEELCQWADVLFLAPQTPHSLEYEGTTPLPDSRRDFDYSFLVKCVKDVSDALPNPKTCVVISTVLPGTIDREVRPAMSPDFRLVYEPLFIAMGTVYRDFLNPEFVLCGVDDPQAADELEAFYKTIHDKPVFRTDVRTAEGIKVFYNTFITTKTVLANLYGEIAQKLRMNVDDIYRALSMATDRLISPKYLEAGMGDGGGCHPRDNIALSWLAKKRGLSFDFFEALMTAREKHCEFLADLIEKNRTWRERSREITLPVVILGRSFKPETNIETGSPAILLSNILRARGIPHGHFEDLDAPFRALYFIGTKHSRYRYYQFPPGSVVIDPFRYIPDQIGVRRVAIGGHAAMLYEVAHA